MKSSSEKAEKAVVVHIGATYVCTAIACLSDCQTLVRVLAVGKESLRGSFCDGVIVHRERFLEALRKSMLAAADMANVEILSVTVCFDSPRMVSANKKSKTPIHGEAISSAHMAQALQAAKNGFVCSNYYLAQFETQMIRLDDSDRSVKSAVGMQGVSNICVNYHLMALPLPLLNGVSGVFSELGVRVDNIVFGITAAAQYALSEEERERGVLLVDIGASSTAFCLYKQNILLFSACINTGGDDINGAVARKLSLTVAEAQRLKTQEVNLRFTKEDKKLFINIHMNGASGVVNRYRLSQSFQEGYENLFAKIDDALNGVGLSLDFCEAGIVLMGQDSRIKGLTHRVNALYKKPTRRVDTNNVFVRAAYNEFIHAPRLEEALRDPSFFAAFGAMKYCLNDEFHEQQSIRDCSKSKTGALGFLQKIKAPFDTLVRLFQKYT